MKRTDHPALGAAVYTGTLPSGLSIYVVPRPGWHRSTAALTVSYGGADRRFILDSETFDAPAGTAHYLEHKMFDMPGGSVDGVFVRQGANANAYTAEAVTSYYFSCMGRFGDNLRTLLQFVSTPYFTAETVEKERGIIGQEIRMYEDDPAFAAYAGCLRLLFGDGPLGSYVTGTERSVAGVTAETLQACHRAFYVPANMVLCAAGDVDPEAVERIALEVLPQERAALPVRDYGPDTGTTPVEMRVQGTADVPAPLFCAGVKLGPAPTGPEALRERLTAELALRCLAGESAPAYLDLYEKGLLNGAFQYELSYAAGLGYVTLEGESRDPEAVAAALLAAAEKGPDPALFQRQKKALYGGFLRLPDDLEELCGCLTEGRFGGFDPLDTPRALASVSCADAAAWAREHLTPGRFAVSTIRPKEG